MNIKLTALCDTLAKCYAGDPGQNSKTVLTPYPLAKRMIDRIKNWGSSVLVVADLGLLVTVAYELGESKVKVYYLPNSEEDEQEAQAMARVNQKLTIVVQPVCYNDLKKVEQIMSAPPKFDVIVANPPYGNLHLKFLEACVKCLTDDGVYVSVQPVRWLQDPLWSLKKGTDAKKMEPVLTGKLESIEILRSKEASRLFGASFGMDLGIFVIRNSGGSMQFDELSNAPWGINIKPLRHIIRNNGFSLDRYDGTQQHFVPLATVLAAGSGRGFYGTTFCHQQYGYFADGVSHQCKYGNGLSLAAAHSANPRRTSGKTEGAVIKAFDTAEEAKNFYDFIKLDAFRFFIYILTQDVHVPTKFLPFPSEPGAFKTPWTNQRFYEHFKIAESEQKVIESTMQQFPVE